MPKPVPVFDKWRPTYLAYRWLFAHGFVRIPLTLGIGFGFVKTVDTVFDDLFVGWNKGNTQGDIWKYVERRTLEKKAEAEE